MPPSGPGRARNERHPLARLIAQKRCAVMRMPLGKNIIAHGAQSARSERAPDCAGVAPPPDGVSRPKGIPAASAHNLAAVPGDQSPGEVIAAIACRVARLRPDWQRPERFFEERSELAEALRRLASILDERR